MEPSPPLIHRPSPLGTINLRWYHINFLIKFQGQRSQKCRNMSSFYQCKSQPSQSHKACLLHSSSLCFRALYLGEQYHFIVNIQWPWQFGSALLQRLFLAVSFLFSKLKREYLTTYTLKSDR